MKLRAKLKIIFFLLTTALMQLGYGQHHHDAPAVHGMLLFGQEKIYLSHLPMFHSPHDYQALFEVEIPKDAKKSYLQSIKNDQKQTIYTIVPQAFILPEIVKGPKTFIAQLFKGHFERGGHPITDNLEFKIKKVIYFKKLIPKMARPLLISPYILIGNKKEQFLIHTIITKPDFDYITQVNLKDISIINKLSHINHINISVNSSNLEPLVAEKEFDATLTNDQTFKIKFNILRSLYLEFGDLSF